MSEQTLLINHGFALKQKDGLPLLIKRNFKRSDSAKEEYKKALKEGKKKFTLTDTVEVDIEEIIIDLHSLKQIVITPRGKGYISTAFIDFAKANNISIYWIDSKGKLEASFLPFHFVKPQLVVKQAEARFNGKSLEIAKFLIELKLESEDMKEYIPKLKKAKDIKEIMQIEAIASNLYFKQWVFDKKWNWNGRHGKVSGNKNAVDPVNTMLNLGYSLLAQQMSEILLKRGFELSIGFLHVNDNKTYWNLLVYDFIEPYRIWIDEQVLKMISGLRIKPMDFIFTDDKTHLNLKDNAFNMALNEFMFALNPLEHKSLPMIRKIEKML